MIRYKVVQWKIWQASVANHLYPAACPIAYQAKVSNKDQFIPLLIKAVKN